MTVQATSQSRYRDLTSQSPLLSSAFNRASKRVFDLTVALTGLLVLLPIALAAAVAIKVGSPGPIFYAGTRVGRGGKVFKLYKFRTMSVDRTESGPGITRHNDPRITGIGRLLRKSKLDELPQLINIVRGEMSLVGPRPEDPRYVAQYTAEQRAVLAVLPGLTSLASIRYRNEEELLDSEDWESAYVERIMPDKLRIDRRYLEHWSLRLDLLILLYTFVVLPSVNEENLL